MLTLGVPTSPGVPAAVAANTITLDYNNLDSVKECFAQMGDEIACVIIEPVAGNMNCIPPSKSFLQGLRELCTVHGIVLIFDEVMSGFRAALGGAQGILRHRAGHDLSGQSHRRRSSGRCLRW